MAKYTLNITGTGSKKDILEQLQWFINDSKNSHVKRFGANYGEVDGELTKL